MVDYVVKLYLYVKYFTIKGDGYEKEANASHIIYYSSKYTANGVQ